jgi:Hg(II)-responsive transcriptional regulator
MVYSERRKQMNTLKTGELAKRAGVNVETLRYYEREGFLPEPDRTESGYRLYPESEVQRVQFIKKAQELGFMLKEIKELLLIQQNPKQLAGDIKKLAKEKIELIEEKIQILHAMRQTLIELTDVCPGDETTVDSCPIIQCLNSNPKKGGE